MKFSGGQIFNSLMALLLLGMNPQMVFAASTPSTPGASLIGGESDNQVGAVCATEKNEAQGKVDEALTACQTWAEDFDTDSPTHKGRGGKDKDTTGDSNTDASFEADIATIKNASSDGDPLKVKAALSTCQKRYGISSKCKMPMTDADSDDVDSPDDGKVYDPDAKGPANSSSCKAQYAKVFARNKKSDKSIMEKEEQRSNDAQKAISDFQSEEQKNEATAQKELQAVMPRLQNDLLGLRDSMNKAEQGMRGKINTLLAQLNGSQKLIASLETRIAHLKASYARNLTNMLRACKVRIRDSDPGGGVQLLTSGELSNCAAVGGLGNCQCAKENKYQTDVETMREADQDKIDELRGQINQENVTIARITNEITNGQTDTHENYTVAQQSIALKTQQANTEAQQLNAQLQQMQTSAQLRMKQLQGEATRAATDFAQAKKDYDEAYKGDKALAEYAKGSDDESTPEDSSLTDIKLGLTSWSASQKVCSGSVASTTPGTTTAPAAADPTRVPATTGQRTQSNSSGCAPGTADMGWGCQPAPSGGGSIH